MAVPTIEQICCIVGADTPRRHSYAGVLPMVNCRSSGTCQWYSPTRQWHTQPSPNTPPGHISCSTPKEMLRMAHKTAFGGPVGQLGCAIILRREGKGREKGEGTKKGGQKTTFSIIIPTETIGKKFTTHYLLNAVATSTATATVAPTIGLLPIPRKPIIST